MNIKTTRFVISVMGVVFLGILAFYGISKGETVTPPLCVSGIMTIVGGYQWGRSYTGAKVIEKENAKQ